MKKLILSLLIAATLHAEAQVGDHRNDFHIGASAGMLLNRMDITPTIKQQQKASPTFGITARYICEKYFTTICGVQIELNFANLGWKERIEDGSGNTYSRDLTYLQMPMLMQMGWGYEQRGCKFIIEAGPQIGLNLGSTEHMGGTTWDTSRRPNNITAQYGLDVDHTIDYGITAGLGLELSTSIGHFILGGRYYFGLGDVFDNSKSGHFSRSAHQTISAKLTYLVDIIKTKQK
ncbi:MAG: PorT family protein [Bacteroidaceae bacterium]|nr:PorT family protein [Bacteroidaceae bacterium]